MRPSIADVAWSMSVQKKYLNFQDIKNSNAVSFPPSCSLLSVLATKCTRSHSLFSQSQQRTAPRTTNGDAHPWTQLKIRRRPPLNATCGSPSTTPTRSDREPPTSTIDSGHKVLRSDDHQTPTDNPTTQTHHWH
jgi:hypothetical protein